jgi:hypothetical protein
MFGDWRFGQLALCPLFVEHIIVDVSSTFEAFRHLD